MSEEMEAVKEILLDESYKTEWIAWEAYCEGLITSDQYDAIVQEQSTLRNALYGGIPL